MKKLFTLAVMILSMINVMTSCDNQEDNFIAQQHVAAQKQAKPAVEISLLVAATPGQMQYFDETYIVEVGGKQHTVKVSDMEAITDSQVLSFDNAKDLERSFEVEGHFYVYPLGMIHAGESAKVVAHKLVVKADHPVEEVDCVEAVNFLSAGRIMNLHTDVKLYPGVYGDDENLAIWTLGVEQQQRVIAEVRY